MGNAVHATRSEWPEPDATNTVSHESETRQSDKPGLGWASQEQKETGTKVRRQVTSWFWGLYPEQLPAAQILSSARSRTTDWHYLQHRSGSPAKKELLDAWGVGRGLQWGHSRQLLPISSLGVLTCFAVLELFQYIPECLYSENCPCSSISCKCENYRRPQGIIQPPTCHRHSSITMFSGSRCKATQNSHKGLCHRKIWTTVFEVGLVLEIWHKWFPNNIKLCLDKTSSKHNLS